MSTILGLAQLSCQNCVRHVREALQQVDGVESVKVNLHYAQIEGSAAAADLVQAVIEAGYQAQTEPVAKFNLALHGLSCRHCVQSLDKALTAFDPNLIYQLSLNELNVYADCEPSALIAVVEKAGYQAQLTTVGESDAFPKTEPKTAAQTTQPDQNLPATQLLLSGMTCASCVLKVEKALAAVPQVAKVNVNLADNSAIVYGQAAPNELLSAVERAGYAAEIVEDQHLRREKQRHNSEKEIRQRKRQASVALLFGFGLMLWGMAFGMRVTAESQGLWLLVGIASALVMAFSGGHFFISAWRNLLHGNATMDTLVALGTGVAWLFSMAIVLFPHFFPENARHLYFEAGMMIIGLVNLGKMLETKAKQRSSNALQKLLDLTPASVNVIADNQVKKLPLQQVKCGMLLALKTGDRVAVDGIVVSGEAWLDESMLSGEPLAVSKKSGDLVKAGTIVDNGSLRIETTQVGEQTVLANIIKLVRQAQSSKPKIALLVDKVAAVFVPIVVVIAILAAVIWALFGPEPKAAHALVVLTTVLIIACPCALGLATPMSVIASVSRAAELGILVRDADALQKAAHVKVVVFDKTGTLTEGKPKLTALYPAQGQSAVELLHWAASLEQQANHPLAKALLESDQIDATALSDVSEFVTYKGMGVGGKIAEQSFYLGNARLIAERNIMIPTALAAQADQESQAGGTVIYLANATQLIGFVVVKDQLRQESKSAVRQLQRSGYRTVMLSGDQQQTAEAVAKQLGIDQVIAGVLPQGKVDVIRALQQQGDKVAMVGDGINDAPALALADVSIAIASGSDVAIETADLTLMRHSIDAVSDVLALSKASIANIKQNLLGAFIYNTLGIPIAAGVLYPFFGILLNPVFAGVAMALSSITVVTNANRLLRFKTDNVSQREAAK
ncbi:Cu+-exporting ATPase [Pasteurella testudinis DSM 23072]|uniref:Copper-exporting P-type ATPase n=1 Tax=Pasteurella testudinis DSM 23072 TaxID=1122938 RepID=A0A1W1UHH5_9PAST|nr:copper-translocating P-type ATPase [Pasteurella testudinis]SMB80520.1 Cu+-exporting ATPase [Pasteurella testudinis DSM 23072]SUB51916.1 cation-transporting ATPase [Pasteurella testudinis]